MKDTRLEREYAAAKARLREMPPVRVPVGYQPWPPPCTPFSMPGSIYIPVPPSERPPGHAADCECPKCAPHLW